MALDTILPSIGRTVAGNLVKMVPGLGSFVGALINAGVSSSITFGIGYALNEACRQIHRHVLDGTNINLSEIFNDEFTEAVLKYAESYRKDTSDKK